MGDSQLWKIKEMLNTYVKVFLKLWIRIRSLSRNTMNQNCDDNCDPSALRMKFAEDNPELIAKIFEGDPLAFEAFTNHGGIRGKVTQVVITDAVKMQTKLYFF